MVRQVVHAANITISGDETVNGAGLGWNFSTSGPRRSTMGWIRLRVQFSPQIAFTVRRWGRPAARLLAARSRLGTPRPPRAAPLSVRARGAHKTAACSRTAAPHAGTRERRTGRNGLRPTGELEPARESHSRPSHRSVATQCNHYPTTVRSPTGATRRSR